jgi:quercetin dioxygenase-like cupin family protein
MNSASSSGNDRQMDGKFVIGGETQMATLDWGRVGWLSNPSVTGAAQLAIIEGHLLLGKGHDFHKHPSQEEVIFIVAGRIEQWIDKEKRLLGPGGCGLHPAERGPRLV